MLVKALRRAGQLPLFQQRYIPDTLIGFLMLFPMWVLLAEQQMSERWCLIGFNLRATTQSPQSGAATEFARHNWVGGGQHNFNSSVKDFVQTNFGLRYAF
jgi:hypothetical protein